MPRYRVAALDEIPSGKMLQCTVAGREIVLCHHRGAFHAFQGECPHQGGPLGQGNLVDGCIVCPWHGWEFSVKKGALDYNPAIALRRYPALVRDGALWVDIDDPGEP